MSLLIRNGLVAGPAGTSMADVLVDGDRVVSVGPEVEAAGADVIDAAGCWVGPGLVDLHVHVREPGQEWKEDVASASAAAAAGGFTAVLAMPNTDPPVDGGHLARFVVERGRAAGCVEVVPTGCITLGRAGEHLAHLDELWEAGVRLFTDDGDTVADTRLLRHAMEYLAERGGVVAEHAEDPGLTRDGHMHEGAVSARLGMLGLPAAAEEIVVGRDLALARLTGVRYHVQHVSTVGTVAMVRAAKEEGLPVTAEVTPHHLTFDHTAVLTMDPAFKMYPPLRTAEDREAVRGALADGTIDAVATDHAPHAAYECDVPFEHAPRGIIGLETAASAFLMALSPDPFTFFSRLSVAPAAIAGLARQGRWVEAGAPANLVVFDPELEWTADSFRSRSQNSPWKGATLRGAPVLTVFEGHVTHGLGR